jgi:hypothetical protein
MADLTLESNNTAEKETNLIATLPASGGFVGDHILAVIPGTTLLDHGANIGGIFGRGVRGVGVHGVSSFGHGVRGEGEIGVFGTSAKEGFAAVYGRHTGLGPGVVGDAAGGQENAGVLGRNPTGLGVRGEGANGVMGQSSSQGLSGVVGVHTGQGNGVFGIAEGAAGERTAGVFGVHKTSNGVLGEGKIGVFGKSSATGGHGVQGEGEIGVFGKSSATGFAAVYGQHTGLGPGVVGDAAGPDNAGVLGRNSTGHGVRSEGQIGVVGTSSSATGFGVVGDATGQDVAGVRGHNSAGAGVRGEGQIGVVGDGVGQDMAGVVGRNIFGEGVRGEGRLGVVGIHLGDETGIGGVFRAGVRGSSSSGPGVLGEGKYGGEFQGTSAQLRLLPGASAGRPTTGDHFIGEIYMDSAATLFVCVANGSPGTWVKVLTAAA